MKTIEEPFTKPEKIDSYLEKLDIAHADKLKQLYVEIRYARDTSFSIPKSYDFFRSKKDYKNLPLSTYAKNLKTHLSNVTSVISVTEKDFYNALEHFSI